MNFSDLKCEDNAVTIELRERYSQFKDTVSFFTGPWGLPVIHVHNDRAEAYISQHGAHVMSYTPAGEEDLLWMSDSSYLESGKPIRGGVPVCWPWFGGHPTDADKPAHGVARTSADWKLYNVISSSNTTLLFFELDSSVETQKVFPYKFKLFFCVTVTDYLGMALQTDNVGDKEFTITQALHTYYNVSNVSDIKVTGLEDCPFTDKVNDANVPYEAAKEAITFSEEVDRIYQNAPGKAVIVDPGMKRNIIVESANSTSAVVWNPWIAKSARMPDYGDKEYPGMVCVETTNVVEDKVVLKPGERKALQAFISVTH